MSRWNWTFGLLAGPFVVLPGLLLGPTRAPLAGPEIPAAFERPGAIATLATAEPNPEAMWRSAALIDTPDAYWTYLRRQPEGSHVEEARLRLERLSVSPAPPIHFAAAEVSDLMPVAASTARPDGQSEAAAPSRVADATVPAAMVTAPAASERQRDPAAGAESRSSAGPVGTPSPDGSGPADRPGPADRLGPAEEPAVLSYAPAIAAGSDPSRELTAAETEPHRLTLGEVVEHPGSAIPTAALDGPAASAQKWPDVRLVSVAAKRRVKLRLAPTHRTRSKPAVGAAQRRRMKLASAARMGRGHPVGNHRTVLRHRRYAPAGVAMSAAGSGSRVQLCTIINGSLCGR